LTLARLETVDAGLYECVATNSVASVVTSTRLIVERTQQYCVIVQPVPPLCVAETVLFVAGQNATMLCRSECNQNVLDEM